MSTDEWLTALERILSFRTGHQLAVSTGNLQARLNQSRHKKSETQSSSKSDGSLHARPTLNNDYVAPVSEIEKKLAVIWQSILGIETVGDSLLAFQQLSQVRLTFPVELPLQQLLFDYSNIEKLAIAIEEVLLQNLEQMSDEDAKALLAML